MSDQTIPFTDIDQETWIRKVEKELKGRSHQELLWQINDRISIYPLLSRGQRLCYEVSLPSKWIFTEKIKVDDETQANKIILSALGQGIQALHIHVDKVINWDLLFNDVELSYIEVAIISENPNIEPDLLNSIEKLSNPPTLRSESIHNILDTDLYQWRMVESLNGNNKDVDSSLCDLFFRLVVQLDEQSDRDCISYLSHLNLEIQVGTSFYLGIAKLRAVRILFLQLLRSINMDDNIAPKITATINTSEWGGGTHKNLITCTTQAMSSILGGADQVVIPSADLSAGEHQGRYQRMARNIHQILVLESQIQKWNDPVKGSNYLETLSYKIAESAWNLLQKKVADKG